MRDPASRLTVTIDIPRWVAAMRECPCNRGCDCTPVTWAVDRVAVALSRPLAIAGVDDRRAERRGLDDARGGIADQRFGLTQCGHENRTRQMSHAMQVVVLQFAQGAQNSA